MMHVSRIAKSGLLRAAEWFGFNDLWAWLYRNRIIILRYHGVMDDPHACGSSWLTRGPIPTAQLREQIRHLKRRYQIIPLDDALEMVRGQRSIRPFCLVLTFDDGYRNNATHALPVLESCDAPATVFVTADFVSDRRPLWFDRLEYSLAHASAPELTIEVDGHTSSFSLRDAADRKRTFDGLKALCKTLDTIDVDRILTRVEASTGRRLADVVGEIDRTAPLTWDQMRALRGSLMSFGSHTLSHQILGRVSAERINDEVSISRRVVEQNLRAPCQTFAYPNGQPGDFNAQTRAALVTAGYSCGLTTLPGFVSVGDDPYELRRISAEGMTDPYELLAQVSGFLPMLLQCRDRARRVWRWIRWALRHPFWGQEH